MKLKEYPVSIFESLKLLSLSSRRLKKGSANHSNVIVSFTSIPSRLHSVHLVIRSLMNQSLRPKKIVLWLDSGMKGEVPYQTRKLEGELFEIRFTTGSTSSHNKLVHALTAYPDHCIVTCDDDLLYPDNWLELLYQEHLKYPHQILCNKCNLITYDAEGHTLPYKQWIKTVNPGTSSFSIMPAGYAGVLYPPDSLLPETTDTNLYLKLAPRADDLWFKCMSFLKGTVCRKVAHPSSNPIPVIGTRTTTLASSNIKEDKNRIQWDALRSHYKFKTPDPEIN